MNLDENTLRNTDINELINSHIPFIIKCISKITNRYVSIENDEEFSVALLAFDEAVKRYSNERGPFLPFASLVIGSRLKNYLKRENKNRIVQSLEVIKEEGIEISSDISSPIEDKALLMEEINKLKESIYDFGFSLEDLVEEAPKHKKTRENAIDLSEKVSQDEHMTDFMYIKKRLPIKQISLKYRVTEKVIKTSKKFIITVVIIFNENFRNLKLWIRK